MGGGKPWRSTKGLHYGLVEDGTIRDLLESSTFLSEFPRVLLAYFDSGPLGLSDPHVRGLIARVPDSRLRADGLLISGTALAQAESIAGFDGFDELWCFDADPTVVRSAEVRIASDGHFPVSGPLPPTVALYMRASGCRLGLGDGCGLTYVTPDPAVAALLEASFAG